MTTALFRTAGRCASSLGAALRARTKAWSNFGFALRTTAASLTALYLAFLIGLDNPKWAAMTVWIVAQTSRGASLSKGQFRIIGTLVGAAVAVALTACFAQTPEVFIPALGLWLAICAAVATGLRNFRAYGAVLAGYTAAIVAFDSVSVPQEVWDIAIARVVYICLGIVTEAVFTTVFSPGAPFRDLQVRLSTYLQRTAAVCAGMLRGEDNITAMQRLFAEALELDVATEYGAAASVSVRRRFGHFRSAMAEALAQVTAARSLRAHLSAHAGLDVAAVAEVADALAVAGQSQADGCAAVARLRSAVDAAITEESRKTDYSMARLFILDRLGALLAADHEARVSEALFADETASPLNLKFDFHVDHVAAVQNGLRVFIALVAGCTVWIMTAWPSGPGFVTIMCVVCALFATRPNPIAGGIGFLKGAAAAILTAALCNFVLLPSVTDFVPMAAVVGTFMAGAGLALRNARLAAPATSFAFIFPDLLNLDNRTRVDAAAFLNGAPALLLGVGGAVLIFSLVFPTNLPQVRRRLTRATLGDLADIGRAPARWTKALWLSKTADRLARQGQTNSCVTPPQAAADLQHMLAALTIGDAVIALDRLALLNAQLRRPLAAVRRRLASGDGKFLSTVARHAVGHLAHDIQRLELPASLTLIRATALLQGLSEAARTGPRNLRDE